MKNIVFYPLLVIVLIGAYSCAGMERGASDVPYGDAEISKIIRNEIASDPELKRQHIAVAVRNGEVVLSGTVQNRAQESRIIKYALGIKGVRSVKDDIKVVKK